MPDEEAPINFLAPLLRYETERPFFAFVTPDIGYDREKHTNIEMQSVRLKIKDIRDRLQSFKLYECGFQVVPWATKLLSFTSTQDLDAYKAESEALLRSFFNAEHVVCFDATVRDLAVAEERGLTWYLASKKCGI